MAQLNRRNRVARKRYLLDKGTPKPVVNTMIDTVAIGTPATRLELTFDNSALYPDGGLPTKLTVGTLSPTSVVSSSPTGITLGFGATLTAGAAYSLSGLDDAWRSAQGGYVLPTAGVL